MIIAYYDDEDDKIKQREVKMAKSFLKDKIANCNGYLVCAATAKEQPIGAIYKLTNGKYEAVPFDDPRILRFNDPHAAQRHIENCKLN